jgi:hypothetical protein
MKTFTDSTNVAFALERVIQRTGRLINRSKVINGEHLQKFSALVNSYSRLLLADAAAEGEEGDRYSDLSDDGSADDDTESAEANENYLSKK